MNALFIVAAVFVFLLCPAALAGNSKEVPDSDSPGGDYAARVEPPANEIDDVDHLSIYRKATGEVIARVALGGYARYPMAADSMNLRLLWSPDSKHLAVMGRTTKRSWEVSVYAIGKGATKVKLPSATEKALKLLSAKEIDRVSRETPVKWLDNDRLLLRAAGDTTVGGELIWYEVDVTFSMKGGKITGAKLIEKRSREG
ncbi:hypothetical protein [Luteolibacter soli]|uniref:Uncharacterized protein n=1 Tax=Luteolibacter soli TaxID=3135280 RepID=A0ABU9AVN1_9BACT